LIILQYSEKIYRIPKEAMANIAREELFEWAQDNMWEYPALDTLREEIIDGVPFLLLPGKCGVYKKLCLCFCENATVLRLRRAGCAVGIVADYETARDLISEYIKFIK